MKRFLTILLMTVAFAMNVSVVNAKISTGQGGAGKEFMMAMMASGEGKWGPNDEWNYKWIDNGGGYQLIIETQSFGWATYNLYYALDDNEFKQQTNWYLELSPQANTSKIRIKAINQTSQQEYIYWWSVSGTSVTYQGLESGGGSTTTTAKPTFSRSGNKITITSTTSGAMIYYNTSNGDSEPATPSVGSTTYSKESPVIVDIPEGGSLMIYAIAKADNLDASEANKSEKYTYTRVTATPTFSRSGNTITISSEEGATIHYGYWWYSSPGNYHNIEMNQTSSGNTVTVELQQHNNPTTIRAYASKNRQDDSEIIISDSYYWEQQSSAPAAPSISINHGFEVNAADGGGYTISNTLTFTESTSGANIYYTTDGTDPKSSGTRQKVSNNQVVIGLDNNYSNVIKIRAVAELSGTYSDETTMDKAYTPELSTNGTTLSITQNDANTYIFYHGNGETTWTCMKSGRTINNYANIAPVSVVAATAEKLLSNIAVQNGGGTLPTSGDWDYGSWNTSSPGSLQINCSGKLLRYTVSNTRGQNEPTASSGESIENSNTFYFPLSSLSSDGTYYLQILTGDYNSTPIGVYTWQVTKSGSSYTYEYLGKNEETPDAPAAPVISIESQSANGTYGTYAYFQITDATEGATIEYSVDGGTTWVTYNNPFYKYTKDINGNSYTIKARATKDDETSETTQTFTKTATPTYSISGTNLTIKSPSNCSYIAYKLDNGNWTKAKLTDNQATISGLSSSSLLSFRVVKDNNTDLYSDVVTNLAAPTISIDKHAYYGEYGGYVYFNKTSATEGATLSYSYDGGITYYNYPTNQLGFYAYTNIINNTLYIKAKLNGHESISSNTFTKTDDPTVNLSGKTLSIEGDYTGFVYKVGNGTWAGELNQKSANLTSTPAAGTEIKVRAYKTGYLFSNEVTYTVPAAKPAEPTISISHGMEKEYCTPATDDFDGNTINSLNNYITLTAEGNPTIYYTIDGSNPITNPNSSRQTYSNKFVCADINNNYSEVSAITVRAVSFANGQYSDIVSTTFTKATSPTISLSGTTLTINGGVWMAYKPNSTSSWIRRLSSTKEITEYDSSNTVSAIAAIQNQLLSNPAIYPTPEGTDWAYGTWKHYYDNEEKLQVLSGPVPDFYYTISGTRYENEPTTSSTYCTSNQATVPLSNLSDGTHYVQILAYNQGPLGVYTWKVTKDGNSYTYEYLGKNETAQTLPAPEFSTNFQGRSGAGEVDPYVFFGISNYDDIIATSGNYIKYSFDGETWKTEIQTKSSAPEIGCILAYADDFERKGDKITIYAKTVNGNNESAVVTKEYTKTDAPTVAHNNGKITITAPQTDWDEIMFSTDGGDNWFIHKSSDDNTFVVYPTTQDAPSYDGNSPLYVLARAFKSGGDYIYSNQDCFIGPAPIKQLKYHYSEMENWFEVNSVVGLKIRYTLDGTNPKESPTAIEFRMDSVYMDKLLCSSLEVDSKTVKTVATDGYGHFSDVVEKTFTKSDMPIFTDYGASIELKVNDSYETIHNVIYYKQNSGDWDGTTWTPLIYKKDFNTIQAVAVLNNWQKLMSDMLIVEVIDTPPTLTYNQNANQVTITCEEGKTLKYSTNGGTTWQTADGQSKTLAVPQEGLSVQAYCTETKVDYPVANKTTIYTSDVSTGNYTYTTPSKTQPDAPTITYTEGSGKVTISTDEEGTTDYPVYLIYTTNGDEPVLGQHYTVENGVPTASDANTVVVTGTSTSFTISETTTVNAKVYCGKYTNPESENEDKTFTIEAPAVQPKVTLINDNFYGSTGDPKNYFRIEFPNGSEYDFNNYSIEYVFTQDGDTLYDANGNSYTGTLNELGNSQIKINEYETQKETYNVIFNPLEFYINNGSCSNLSYPFNDEHPLIIKMRVISKDTSDPVGGFAYSTPYTQSTAVVPKTNNATDPMEVTFGAEPSDGYSSTNPLTFYYRYSKKSSDVWSDRIEADEATDFTDKKITYTTPSTLLGYVYTVSSQTDHLKVANKCNITKYVKPDKPGISYDDTTPGETTVTIHTDEEGTTEHPAYLYYTTDGNEPVINGADSDDPSVGPGTKMVELNDKSFTLTIANGGSKTVKAIVYCPNADKYTTYESDDSIKYCPVWRDWELYGRGAWEYKKGSDMYVYNAENTTDIEIATDISDPTHKRIKIDGMIDVIRNSGDYDKEDEDDSKYKDFIFEWDMTNDKCESNYQYTGLTEKGDEKKFVMAYCQYQAEVSGYKPNLDSYQPSFNLVDSYSKNEYIWVATADSKTFTLKMDGLWLGDMEEYGQNTETTDYDYAIQYSYMPENSHYKIGLVKIDRDNENLTFEDGKCFINLKNAEDVETFFETNSNFVANAIKTGDAYTTISERHYFDSVKGSDSHPLLENSEDAYKMCDQFKIAEEGAYYIIAARLVPSYDEEGNSCYVYSGAYRYMPVYYSPSRNWKTLSYDGMRTYRDDIVYGYFHEWATEEWYNDNDWIDDIDQPVYSVEVQENKDDPGLFRVKNMYHEGFTGGDEDNSLTSYQGESPYRDGVYFYIDARDADDVKHYPSEFYAQPLGVDWYSGEMMLTMLEGGKYIDGQIVFDSDESDIKVYEFDDLVNNFWDTKLGNVLPVDACWPVNRDYNDDTNYGELYDNRFKLQISTPYPLYDDTPYTTEAMNPKWPKEYKDEEKGIDNSEDYAEKYGELAIFDSSSSYYNSCYTDGITEGQDHVDVTYERDLKNSWGTIMLPCPLKAGDLKLEGENISDEDLIQFQLYYISGFKVNSDETIDNKTITFEEFSSDATIEANTPVVFKCSQAIPADTKLVVDIKDTKVIAVGPTYNTTTYVKKQDINEKDLDLYIYQGENSDWQTIANYTPVAITTSEGPQTDGYQVITSYPLKQSYAINGDRMNQVTGGIRNKQYRAFFFYNPKDSDATATLAKSYAVFFDDDAPFTSVIDPISGDEQRRGAEGRYNVAGQKVKSGYRGIVIENGKKRFVK